MHVGLIYGNTEAVGGAAARDLVQWFEAAGGESLWAIEHVVVPRTGSSQDRWRGRPLDDMDIADPVVWLAHAAAWSTTLRLAGGIVVLPQQHPLQVAKAWATLDQLSDGRAMLGVGMGYLDSELRAVGVDPVEREDRFVEHIEAIRTAWSADASTFQGRFSKWEDMVCRPRPRQPSGVPIVLGAGGPKAARRAASLGDGMLWPGSLGLQSHDEAHRTKASQLVDALERGLDEAGRARGEVELTVGVSARITDDDLDHFRDLGVARVLVSARDVTAGDVERLVERLAS